jgi:2-dehydro-3-deoxygalactonokinase
MLSSEVGLTSVRHAVAPAGIAELASAAVEYRLPDFEGPPILIVPGVRTPAGLGAAGWLDADVMRGEEVETLGAVAALRLAGRSVAFLWPGSHTKLVEVDFEGRILRSYTTLAGEITATLASHTIISKSLPSTLPEEPDRGAVELGMRTAVEAGIGRAAFAVRLAELSGSLDAHGRASFWVGAVIGEDCARIAAHPIAKSGAPIWVGGRDPQRRLYADRLATLVESPIAMIEEPLATTASAVGAGLVADVYDASIKNR